MLNESLVVVTLYLHTAKIAVKTFVIKQLQISKSANFACLAWRAEYSNRFSSAAGIVVPPGILNTGSYDAGTWPTPRCHSEVCLWWTLWRKLLEGRLLTETHTIKQIMQKLSINSQQTKNATADGSQGVYKLHTQRDWINWIMINSFLYLFLKI